jgi:methyl-accepting chemotaxis protein
MGELIAEDEGKEGGEGGGIALDVFNLGNDLIHDGVGWESGIDTAMVAIDVISTWEDPLRGLIAAGVGWLLEHIPGISDVWDKLMGDASSIEQIANTWDNISRALNTSCTDFTQASNQIETWSGPARESYRQVAQAFESSVNGTSVESEAISIVVRLIGAIVAGLKDIVYTLIAEFIEFTVLPAILSAIATSWCTFGGSVAAAITYIEIQADITAEEITVKITHVTEEIVVMSERASKIIAKLDKMKASLKSMAEEMEKNKTLAKQLKEWALAGTHGGVEQGRGAYRHSQEGGEEPGGENSGGETEGG